MLICIVEDVLLAIFTLFVCFDLGVYDECVHCQCSLVLQVFFQNVPDKIRWIITDITVLIKIKLFNVCYVINMINCTFVVALIDRLGSTHDFFGQFMSFTVQFFSYQQNQFSLMFFGEIYSKKIKLIFLFDL